MAIRKTTNEPPTTEREYRDMLHTFTQDESGVKALQSMFDGSNKIQREGMYLLEILNNVISNTNGTEKVFQRIPQEVFGGLSEGGRRNVQASLIARSLQGTDKAQQGRIDQTGYTRIQQMIGHWAERDGSWSDTPEADLINKGYYHNPSDDGSEARIFDPEDGGSLIKTIDFSHYSDFELMLDRIAIHNATFPEMAMTVRGFGMREDAEDNSGFVVIVSQPKAEGTVPTIDQIKDGMKQRFFNRSENGFFWINGLDNIVVADIHDMNCVLSPEGRLLVFDCEAFLKLFPVDSMKPEIYELSDLLPNQNGYFNEEKWKEILGDQYTAATAQDKSEIIRELRRTGKVNGQIEGKIITLESPVKKARQLPDGRTEVYYDARRVLVGEPKTFKKEHFWKVPEIQFNPENEAKIKAIVSELMPMVMPIDLFLNAQRYVGTQIASRGGAAKQKEMLDELHKTGRVDGLVNGRYVVQLNPENQNTVLLTDYRKLQFMLWSNNTEMPRIGRLTNEEKQLLSQGEMITKSGIDICFNLDKGRVDTAIAFQRKLNLTKSRQRNVERKPMKGHKMTV